jgi:hypothetical protein
MRKNGKRNLFDLVPVISKHITTEKEGELSVIAFPRFRSAFLQKHLTSKHRSPLIRVRLEEHGTAVWDLIDGKRTVGEITELLATHFNEGENYTYRITSYLSQLYTQGFIKYNIRTPDLA